MNPPDVPRITPTPNLKSWVQGELVGAQDMLDIGELIVTAGSLFCRIITGDVNLNDSLFPITITVTGPGQCTIGGTTSYVVNGQTLAGVQICVLQGRLCVAYQTVLNFQPNSTNQPRLDTVYAWNVQHQINPQTRKVRQPDKTLLDQTVYEIQQGIEYAVLQPGDPVPQFYTKMAEVTVLPNGSSILNNPPYSPIVKLPLFKDFLASQASASVSSLNQLTGAVVITSADGSVTVTKNTVNTTIDLHVPPPPAAATPTTVDGIGGAITLTSNDSSVTIKPSGQSIDFHVPPPAASGVTALDGLAGALTFESTDASVAFTNDGTTKINVQAKGVTALDGLAGALTFESTDASVAFTNDGTTKINVQAKISSVSSPDGSVLVATTSGAVSLEASRVTDSNDAIYPSGVVKSGSAITNANGLFTVGIASVEGHVGRMLSGTATFYDATFANSVDIAVQNFTSTAITFSARYVNVSPPTLAAGVGVYYTVVFV